MRKGDLRGLGQAIPLSMEAPQLAACGWPPPALINQNFPVHLLWASPCAGG